MARGGGARRTDGPRAGVPAPVEGPFDGAEVLADLLVDPPGAPDGVQYRFAGPAGERVLSRASVRRLAQRVGAALAADHAPGATALLLTPPGSPFVAAYLGCQQAGLVAVPTAVPGRGRASAAIERLEAVIADCDPDLVITTAELQATFEDGRQLPAARRARWHCVEELAAHDPDPSWAAAPRRPADLAHLQYTSGTTAAPRGVELTHAAVLANLRTIGQAFAIRPGDRGVIWLPPHHDMGLVGGVLVPLAHRFEVTLADPARFLQSPARWLRWISDHGATISGGPDFAYRLCVDRIRDDQLEGIDLRTWRVAFTGAEPVQASTIADFTERFAPLGFRPEAVFPCYGLAEATLLVTGTDAAAPPVVRTVSRRALDHDGVALPPDGEVDERSLVGCGRAVGAHDRVVVVDPRRHHPVAEGTVGEIWYRGPSAARGYHGDPPGADTFGAHTDAGDGPFLRTGDLGFELDGQLYLTGRRKDVLIVRGRNLDAHDVESTVRDALSGTPRLGAVAAVPDGDGHGLVVVVEAGRAARAGSSVEQAVQASLAGRFGVRADRVVVAAPGSLPRTTSGKVRRSATQALLPSGTLDDSTPERK